VRAVHAVDAAGVHPLLLAIGSERYTPFAELARPQELLTQANAILGQGQLSLAKYLLIVNGADDPQLDIQNVEQFFLHVLRRIDWRRDLHFQTCTTIDTLDTRWPTERRLQSCYRSHWPARRELPTELPPNLGCLMDFVIRRFAYPVCWLFRDRNTRSLTATLTRLCPNFVPLFHRPIRLMVFPLIVIVDDSQFTAKTLANFLWVTFTRSNPAADIDGIGAFCENQTLGVHGFACDRCPIETASRGALRSRSRSSAAGKIRCLLGVAHWQEWVKSDATTMLEYQHATSIVVSANVLIPARHDRRQFSERGNLSVAART